MDKEEETSNSHAHVYVTAGLLAAGTVYYARIVRPERKKRKQIKEWKANCKSAIESSRERMMRLALDPNTTAKAYMEAWAEESEFINLIQNQPMY